MARTLTFAEMVECDDAFDRWWTEKYDAVFLKMTGAMWGAMREMTKAAFIAGWAAA